MILKTIVFRTGYFPLPSQTFITNHVVSAIRMGYDVKLLVDKKGTIQNTSQKDLIEEYDLLNKTFEIPRYNFNGRLKMLKKLLYFIKYVLQGPPLKSFSTFNYFVYGKEGLKGNLFFKYNALKDFIKTDLFHIQFGLFCEPLVTLKKHKLIGSKLITTFHGYDVHYTTGSIEERRSFYETLFDVGSLFTANTVYLAKMLEAINCSNTKLQIVPMGIDTNLFTPQPIVREKSEIVLISVGRIVDWKGQKYGVLTVKNLIDKGYDVIYHIVGDGINREEIQELIIKLNLEDNVFLHGMKSQFEIKDFFSLSDIFLMTSNFDDTGRRETQGVVTGEAQASGLPVVAFRSGGVPYTIIEGETGFLSEERDYLGMSQNIEILINDEVLRRQMGANARKFIEKDYSIEVVSKKWELLYKHIV